MSVYFCSYLYLYCLYPETSGYTPVCSRVNIVRKKYYTIKTYGGMEIWFHVISLAVDGTEWLASLSGCFIARQSFFGTPCLGNLMDVKASLDVVTKDKVRISARTRIPIV